MALIASILSKFDDTGIKRAKKAFGGLKTALGAVGIGLGIQQVTDTLVEAAKAASADQKSMQLLNDQLKRNAKATPAQIKQNNQFIDTLSTQVGIVDDELRPAMGKLVRVTGDTKKSQQLLKLALDASSASGKPLNTVTDALSKAFVGNKTQLIRLFPALKESKNLFGDLEKQVSGTAAQQADPFSKLTVALDNLKEKLGYFILPYITDFIDQLIAPGGAVDAVNQFFDDVSNPKTDAGKAFRTFSAEVKSSIESIKNTFAMLGEGDVVKGFGNFLNILSQISYWLGQISDKVQYLNPVLLVVKEFSAMGSQQRTMQEAKDAIARAKENAKNNPQLKMPEPAIPGAWSMNSQPPNVTINVQNADPKATVDALSKYLKQNGHTTLGQALRN